MAMRADELKDMVEAARSIVAFTGAGISTECGIPDFRSKDSAWRRHPPMPFDEFLASDENRAEAWRRKFAMDDLYGDAKPGRGHRALASLCASGKLIAIITQNIDGLHEAAGVPREKIIELHGNGRHASEIRGDRRAPALPVRRARQDRDHIIWTTNAC
jgi:NAD-dependent deacetylase